MGRMNRYKDCFSPDFRILQEILHTYVNLIRILERLKKRIRLQYLGKENLVDCIQNGGASTTSTTANYTLMTT